MLVVQSQNMHTDPLDVASCDLLENAPNKTSRGQAKSPSLSTSSTVFRSLWPPHQNSTCFLSIFQNSSEPIFHDCQTIELFSNCLLSSTLFSIIYTRFLSFPSLSFFFSTWNLTNLSRYCR